MDSNELIELFYNRAYEKFVNKQILDDKNYIVPRQQLMNYVHELVNIPFIDFLDYIKESSPERVITASDVTLFSSFASCEIEMCNALIWANNPGCQYIDIGRFFPNSITSRSDSAYRKYGENHIKAATQLGLTFEYYKYWYLSCLGYIYPDLDGEERKQLLARTITRNRLYQLLLIDILEQDINPETYLEKFLNLKKRGSVTSVCRFLQFCLDECREEDIKTYSLQIIDKSNKVPANIILPSDISSHFREFLIEYNYRRFSNEAIKELICRYQNEDKEAFNLLIEGKMSLVISIAKIYLHKGVDFEDLIQEGIIGLIRAFDHYNFRLNLDFNTYASWWIKQAILQALATLPLTVKVPNNVISQHGKVWRFINSFEQQYGYFPSVNDYATDEYVDFSAIKLFYSLPYSINDLTIYQNDWDEWTSENASPDASLMEDATSLYVNFLLSKLKKREAIILQMVYGIGCNEETLSNIGDLFGYTRERVRQIKEKAIKTLREIVTTYAMEGKAERIIKEDDNNTRKVYYSHIIDKAILLRENKPQLKQKTFKKNKQAPNSTTNKEDYNQLSKKSKKKVKQKNHVLKEAMVGDRILYDAKRCTVIKKKTIMGSLRLIVKYDNGTFDNLLNDWKRYQVI